MFTVLRISLEMGLDCKLFGSVVVVFVLSCIANGELTELVGFVLMKGKTALRGGSEVDRFSIRLSKLRFPDASQGLTGSE